MFDHLGLLALDFGSQWMLFGLGGAAIPVIIHLLHKRKYKETSWAAMRFLAEAARKHSRRLRWEQLLLLLVRCLAVGCFALALSRPFFEASSASESSYQPRHLIFVVDNSFSMGLVQTGGATLLDEARGLVRRIVEGTRVGDGFSLVTMTAGEFGTVIQAPTYNKASILAEAEALPLTERTVDLNATVARLRNVLKEAPELPQKEIVLIGDFQRRDWPTSDDARMQALRAQWNDLAGRAQFVFYNLSSGSSPNAAVTSVRVAGRPALVGKTIGIRGDIQAWGGEPLGGKTVELVVDGRPTASRRIEQVQENRASVNFDYVCEKTGQRRIEVRLKTDRLAADNVGYATLRVSDAVRVLLVDGRFSSPPRERSSYYLSQALTAQPGAERSFATSGDDVEVTVVDPLGVSDLPLNRFDVIGLCNLQSLNPGEARRLNAYLDQGGSLLVVLGDLTDAGAWNERLESGLPLEVPFRLGPFSSTAPEAITVVGFLAEDLDHPIVSAFRGNPGSGLESALIWNYVKLVWKQPANEFVVLQYDNGDAAIIDVPAPNGRCLFVTTSLDALWGSWAPLSGSFPPIANEMIQYSVRGSDDERTVVATPLSGTLPPEAAAAAIAIVPPTKTPQSLTPLRERQAVRWQYDDTSHSGFYRLDVGAPVLSSRNYAVSVDVSESDLSSISEADLQKDYFSAETISYRTFAPAGEERISSALLTDHSPLIVILLWAALVLLAIEVLMAGSFRIGTAALVIALLFGVSMLLGSIYGTEIGVSCGMLLAALLILYAVRKGLTGLRTHRNPLTPRGWK